MFNINVAKMINHNGLILIDEDNLFIKNIYLYYCDITNSDDGYDFEYFFSFTHPINQIKNKYGQYSFKAISLDDFVRHFNDKK